MYLILFLYTWLHGFTQTIYRFRCAQWDVNNENMLSNFYELNTGNAQITERMFTQMHEVDSAPLLFLNEKDAIIDTNLAMVSGYSIIWFVKQSIRILVCLAELFMGSVVVCRFR